jgi:hypothetical protein
MNINTRVDYMYRDASNYKFHGSFVVGGTLCQSDLEDFLFYGEFFVPHEVGLDHLLDMPMNQDDHYLHTIEAYNPIDESEVFCGREELVIRFKMANERGWFSSFYRD